MSDTALLSQKLRSEGARMLEFFSRLEDKDWEKNVYTEGTTWNVRQVLSHFVTSEQGLVQLFEEIRKGGEGASENFSIDRFNAAQQKTMEGKNPIDLVDQFQRVRSSSATWVKGLKDEELEISGRHPFLQMTTLREMIKMLYLHNQLHSRDIKKALGS